MTLSLRRTRTDEELRPSPVEGKGGGGGGGVTRAENAVGGHRRALWALNLGPYIPCIPVNDGEVAGRHHKNRDHRFTVAGNGLQFERISPWSS